MHLNCFDCFDLLEKALPTIRNMNYLPERLRFHCPRAVRTLWNVYLVSGRCGKGLISHKNSHSVWGVVVVLVLWLYVLLPSPGFSLTFYGLLFFIPEFYELSNLKVVKCMLSSLLRGINLLLLIILRPSDWEL